MAAKPTILFVPGAWHRDTCLQLLVDAIKKRGFEIRTTTLKSVGRAGVNAAQNTKGIQDNLIGPLVSEGREVVLVLHSFGAISGGAAAKGWTVPERMAQGLRGGVVGLICIASILALPGVPMFSEGRPLQDWITHDEEAGLLIPNDPKERFYNDVEDQKLAKQLIDQLEPESYYSMADIIPPTAVTDPYFDGKRVYIRTTIDACMPTAWQGPMAESMGVGWTFEELESGHSPFASQPEKLADILVKYAAQWGP